MTPFSRHQAPGSRWLRRGDAVGRLDLHRDRRQRRQLLALLGLELVGVLLLGHADRADALGVEELADDRLLGGEQHLARAEHREVPVVEQADVVGHRAGGVDVVGDDQERRVDLGVQVDDQLVQERRTHRVEAGVRLVEEHDLGVEHQRAGQAGALAHAAGDLAGQLVLGADQADQVHLLHDDVADLGLGLLGVLAQREGDVVVEVHRAEHGAVLEQHAEQLADLVELLLGAARDVGALDDDRALVGLEQADQGLQEHRLAGAGRTEHHADLAGRDRQGHVTPDQLLAERLAQVVDLDLHTHDVDSLSLAYSPIPAGHSPRNAGAPALPDRAHSRVTTGVGGRGYAESGLDVTEVRDGPRGVEGAVATVVSAPEMPGMQQGGHPRGWPPCRRSGCYSVKERVT